MRPTWDLPEPLRVLLLPLYRLPSSVTPSSLYQWDPRYGPTVVLRTGPDRSKVRRTSKVYSGARYGGRAFDVVYDALKRGE